MFRKNILIELKCEKSWHLLGEKKTEEVYRFSYLENQSWYFL